VKKVCNFVTDPRHGNLSTALPITKISIPPLNIELGKVAQKISYPPVSPSVRQQVTENKKGEGEACQRAMILITNEWL
jgi:hypothetical protein